MTVEIITPEKNLFAGEAESLIVPALDGEMGILNHHAPIISALKAGNVKLRTNGKEETFEINGGVLEVNSNKVIVLAE